MAFIHRALLALLIQGASAGHTAGPVDDRLRGCLAKDGLMYPLDLSENVIGNLPWNVFTSPPYNLAMFISDLRWALCAMGYIADCEIEFTEVAGGWATKNLSKGKAKYNVSEAFIAACTFCSAEFEPIWQPMGRFACPILSGVPFPCEEEYQACVAAHPDDESVVTGSVETLDLKFKDVKFGTMVPSDSICHPEASFGGYKVAYNLTAGCTGNNLEKPEVQSFAKCLQKSRNSVAFYSEEQRCLDIGGPDCGEPYVCSSGDPVDVTEEEVETEMTCGDVKKMYKANGCCGNPTKEFTVDRRMNTVEDGAPDDEDAILTRIESALDSALASGGEKARASLAAKLQSVVNWSGGSI